MQDFASDTATGCAYLICAERYHLHAHILIWLLDKINTRLSALGVCAMPGERKRERDREITNFGAFVFLFLNVLLLFRFCTRITHNSLSLTNTLMLISIEIASDDNDQIKYWMCGREG